MLNLIFSVLIFLCAVGTIIGLAGFLLLLAIDAITNNRVSLYSSKPMSRIVLPAMGCSVLTFWLLIILAFVQEIFN